MNATKQRLINKRDLMVLGLTFSFGVITFFSGYQRGWEDHQERQQISGVIRSQSIIPLQSGPRLALPEGHPRVPQVDRYGHPTFDCSTLKSSVPKAEGEPTIAMLSREKTSKPREVSLSAIVIGAYFGILGTNWYHLCDEPNGQVLVVSSDQLTPPKSIINARGSLLFDYNLSDIYRFPIYIKEARLSGAKVKNALPDHPKGVIEL